MTARGNLIGLLGAVVILATFAFSTTDRASAQSVYNYSIQCHPESGVWYVTDGTRSVARSSIPCDEATPGWTFDSRPIVRADDIYGEIVFLYDGDTAPGDSLPVQEQGNTPPPVDQPLASTNAILYEADDNNRAVRGADGHCYREQKLTNGKWKRSGTYGWGTALTSQSCRRAAWNAYYRSQGETLRNPVSGSFPPSWHTLP